MENHHALISTVFLFACGPLLEDGTYDVTGDLADNACAFAVDNSFSTEWKITDKGDGDWTLQAEGGGSTASGSEDDGSLSFHDALSGYDAASDCATLQSVEIDITPDDGSSFSGTMTVVNEADCTDGSYAMCEYIYDVEGEL
jgi:hypothetical protein